MKAQEFRIGNFLQDREGRICKVETLTVDKFTREEVKAPAMAGPITAHPHSPIPITGEWLQKLGFILETNDEEQPDNVSKTYWTGKDPIEIDTEDTLLVLIEGTFITGLSNNILFVHQLQNLYFALTGKEL